MTSDHDTRPKCLRCDGKGYDLKEWLGDIPVFRDCPECNGEGTREQA